jgi:hypothetical protein
MAIHSDPQPDDRVCHAAWLVQAMDQLRMGSLKRHGATPAGRFNDRRMPFADRYVFSANEGLARSALALYQDSARARPE